MTAYIPTTAWAIVLCVALLLLPIAYAEEVPARLLLAEAEPRWESARFPVDRIDGLLKLVPVVDNGTYSIFAFTSNAAYSITMRNGRAHLEPRGTVSASLRIAELQTADVNADRRDEFVATTEDGSVYVGAPEHEVKWRRITTQVPSYKPRIVGTGFLDPDNAADVIMTGERGMWMLWKGDPQQDLLLGRVSQEPRVSVDSILGTLERSSKRMVGLFRTEDFYGFKPMEASFEPWHLYFTFDSLLELPADSPWTLVGNADVNGDNRPDAILLGSRLHGLWVALATGEDAIQKFVELPTRGALVPENWKTAVVDIDDDGLVDIVAWNGGPELFVNYSRFARPAPDFVVSLDQRTVRTDADGNFTTIPGPVETQTDKGVLISGNFRYGARRSYLLIPDELERTRRGAAASLHHFTRGPYACIGFNGWGQHKWGRTLRCPPGYGAYSTDDVSRTYRTDAAVTLSLGCCRLPNDDILNHDLVHVVDSACPEDSIVTGTRYQRPCPTCVQPVECTAINTTRYQLGSSTPASYWGLGQSLRGEEAAISLEKIPFALRESVARGSYDNWDVDGCVGTPYGALLVAKATGNCTNYSYRQLQYRGLPGDPPAGTPVEMLPPCSTRLDPFDPLRGCTSIETLKR